MVARLIKRQDGVLTLSDGTLAGADLNLAKAVHTMVREVGVDLSSALQMATSVPASLIRLDYGFGSPSGPFRLRADLSNARPDSEHLELEKSA